MQDWLSHPVVQGVVIPFLVGLAASAALAPLRLAGLSVVAGFAAALYVVAGFQFTPLTTIRKIMLLGLIAPAVGIVVDLAFKPTRIAAPLFGVMVGAASVWVFLTVLAQKQLTQAVLAGGGTAIYIAWTAGFLITLRDNSVRASAASFALGLGTGIAAVLAASATLGLYALAVGTASSAFLLVQMILGRQIFAGMTFTLTAGLLGGLLGAATLHLAQLPWHALAVMAFVPVAARVPLPARWPVWGQAIAISVPALGVAALSCYLAWQSSRGPSG